MMKVVFCKLVFTIVLILVKILAHGQGYKVTGKVVGPTFQSMEYVNVVAFHHQMAHNVGDISGVDGSFELILERGEYEVNFTFIGYVPKTVLIQVEGDRDLGEVQLEESMGVLAGVTVVARKPVIERKADRLIFHVENSTMSSGGNALELLKRTPRVRVQNEEVAMIGKNGMYVLINDRMLKLSGEELAQYLKSIPSDQIKSIEVIANPPARYSAAGNSGLINIVTKDAVQDEYSLSFRSAIKRATYTSGTGGVDFTAKKGKVGLTTGMDVDRGAIAADYWSETEYTEKNWLQKEEAKRFGKSLSGRLEVDWEVSDKLAMGAGFRQIGAWPSSKDFSRIELRDSTGEIDTAYISTGRDQNTKGTTTLNYHIDLEFDTVGRRLSFDVDFLGFANNSKRDFMLNGVDEQQEPILGTSRAAVNKGRQKVRNYSYSLDMVHPVDWVDFRYGVRWSSIKTDNGFEYYNRLEDEGLVLDPAQSNSFVYQERTGSVYVSMLRKWSEKWEMKAGGRLEDTRTVGHSATMGTATTLKYTRFFPSAYLSYTSGTDHFLSLSYGRRVNRPSYSFLNPFRWVTSSYSYLEGNPFLRPSFTDNLEASYSYNDILFTTVYYSGLTDGFEQMTFIDEKTNIQRTVPENFITNKSFGVNQSVAFEFAEKWSGQLDVDIYYSRSRSDLLVTLPLLSGWNGAITASTDVSLNRSKTLLLNAWYTYMTKGVANLDYNSSFGQFDVSVKWLLWDEKMTVSLYGNDLLRTSRITYTTNYSNGLVNFFSSYYDQRYVRLSLAYRIGGKTKNKNRKRKNEAEIDRLN
ncbi:hypothetical protein DN752_09235 [Echinicola strongylocentroti]|uniref:Outer membrane protein beta-barrel domain-containing protein n=1 Tax=Echinicola strongylocentroti TaxID=1795355 RepID=A0A2Z4IGK3_9BACT|nr:outer membrane beta-barrel family protein [Echinicola strongylocentroti]AWW30291.1 hypothetical protein DN752_09235 [Echinicola strongylocentroti]